MALKRGIEKATEVAVDELKKLSKATKDQAEIAQVGTISANNDSHHRRISSPRPWRRLARTVSSQSRKPRVSRPRWKWLKGMQFDRGYHLTVLRHAIRILWKPSLSEPYVLHQSTRRSAHNEGPPPHSGKGQSEWDAASSDHRRGRIEGARRWPLLL